MIDIQTASNTVVSQGIFASTQAEGDLSEYLDIIQGFAEINPELVQVANDLYVHAEIGNMQRMMD